MFNGIELQQENQRLKAQMTMLLQENNQLKTNVVSLEEKLTESKSTQATQQQQITNLLEQIKLMRHRTFGTKSEANLLQQSLFDEIGVADQTPLEPDTQTITYTRKKKGQGHWVVLAEGLEQVEIILDIDEADRHCPCCDKERSKMGEEVSERLITIPAKIKVERTIRPQYVCKNPQCDENTIVIQTLPPRILTKSYASPSIIADILTKKYIEHMPLYRQQQSWKRVGVKLPRNTMCNWLMTLAKECSPLYQLLREHAIHYNILYIDETTGQVLGEPGRDNRKKSYIWAYRGGPPDQPVVYYEYQESRSAEHPMRFLKDYSGVVLTDAYTGYDWIDAEAGFRLIHVFCMSHARRNFADIVKITKTEGYAHQAISYFEKLYAVEKTAREQNLTPAARFYLRLTEAKPVLYQLFTFLEETLPKANPNGKLGKAISYMLQRKEGFYAYLTDGRLEIDNNLLENQIRPFALGRKNWLFLGSPRGAEAACMFYTLLQTAIANGLDPRQYLTDMLEQLPYCQTKDDYKRLLPWRIILKTNEVNNECK